MTTSIESSRHKPRRNMLLHAMPFYVCAIYVPLMALGMMYGGGWLALVLLFSFFAAPLIDLLTSHNSENLDPTTEDAALVWHKAVTWLWVPIQFGLIISMLAVIGQTDWLNGIEISALAISVGVATGGIGITFAHELMHQRNRFERGLAEALMCSTLYGHFCIEHVYGHHRNVATDADPASAREGESIYAFLPRTILGSWRSAWHIQKDQLAKRRKSVWSLDNGFWRYAAWTIAWLSLAYGLASWVGVAAFLAQAAVAILLLEVVNYLEHYGLRRRKLANGRFEPTREHHSWNANHRFTNYLLINLQRHSDHHSRPDRRFALLQAHDPSVAPQLPHGYSWMVLLALVPPLWFRTMNPRVAAWKRQFYPQGQ